MTYSATESREGLYDIYYQTDGKKIIVLEGLNPTDTYESPYLQQQIHAHYQLFELGYWLLFVVVIVYMAGLYVVFPVLRRCKLV